MCTNYMVVTGCSVKGWFTEPTGSRIQIRAMMDTLKRIDLCKSAGRLFGYNHVYGNSSNTAPRQISLTSVFLRTVVRSSC